MKRDALHVFYIAMTVFVAVISIAIYTRPLAAHVRVPASSRQIIYLVEPKYILVPWKEPCTWLGSCKK